MKNPITAAIRDTMYQGGSFKAALVKMIKASSKGPQITMVRSMVYSLLDHPETRHLGVFAMGVLQRDMGYFNAANKYFEEVEKDGPLKEGLMPRLEVGLTADPETTLPRIRKILSSPGLKDGTRQA